jgi:hypothetical protein
MKYTVEKIEFWSGEIRDAVGGLATGLKPVVDAGANFAFVIARRFPEHAGMGLVFFSGLSGAKQVKAAKSAGFVKADFPGLRIEAADKPGTVEAIVTLMAEAGINLRGVTAAGCGTKCQVILAFDSAKDREQAARVLRKSPPKIRARRKPSR